MEESSNVKKVESGSKQFSMPEMVKNIGSKCYGYITKKGRKGLPTDFKERVHKVQD